MAKAKAKIQSKDDIANTLVLVECLDGKDCWTPGGFLASGDRAKITTVLAERLAENGKVKIIKEVG